MEAGAVSLCAETVQVTAATNVDSNSRSAPLSSDPFGSTRWSLVLAAANEGTTAREALESLCTAYWLPVYFYVRRRAANADDAQDLTQAFFAMLLEHRTLAAADHARGRFRAFLLTALRNFLANEHERATALKRGGANASESPVRLRYGSRVVLCGNSDKGTRFKRRKIF